MRWNFFPVILTIPDFLLLKEHSAMSGDTCYDWEVPEHSAGREVRDAAKHLTMHRTAPYNKELPCPKCQ